MNSFLIENLRGNIYAKSHPDCESVSQYYIGKGTIKALLLNYSIQHGRLYTDNARERFTVEERASGTSKENQKKKK